MKLATLIAAIAGLIVLHSTSSAAAERTKKPTKARIDLPSRLTPSQKKLLEIRTILIERKKSSREGLKNALSAYEEKLADQVADYEIKKKLHEENLISNVELESSERALTNTRLETERVRQWISEDDIALSLAQEREMERLPGLPPGGYAETATLIRYNGVASWSPADVGKIAKFFRARFGQPLPVSAMGQSSLHDRMGFDHREAVDVAVAPDSAEGRGLIEYLLNAGIPFIAFRGKIPSMSTGAHIHVGRPSPRILEVKHRPTRLAAPNHDRSAVDGTSAGQ